MTYEFQSDRCARIWKEYAAIFKSRWGINEIESWFIGSYSKKLFAAEFRERGRQVYHDSLLIPIRNAWYASHVTEMRWKNFTERFRITEPILDYGCGVGFLLVFLSEIGFTELYGYELGGIQRDIFLDMAIPRGIKHEESPPNISTTFCLNVLEHVQDPVTLLKKLKRNSAQVIANICMDRDDSPHIAPLESLKQCKSMLEEWGTLYEGKWALQAGCN